MSYIVKAIAGILITVFLVSCATPVPAPAVPEIPSDITYFEQLIDEPSTEQDLIHNMTVLEFMYINQKLQTYSLLQYIAKLADDAGAYSSYGEKIAEIKSIYALS